MFGFGSKAKKMQAEVAAKDLESVTRLLMAGTDFSLSQALRADHAVHGMEALSTLDQLEMKAMGF